MGGLQPGTVLADTYRIVRLLGAGGMGEVYEAAHHRLAGRYAVKILRAGLGQAPETLARFRREAEITSSLRHPNIVQVLDFNVTSDGLPYLVMEFLEGRELTQMVEGGAPLPIPQVLELVGQIASGLAAAHAHKVVHRDLKPQNLFLLRLPGDEERDVVKIVDFGISKVREATVKLTQDSTLMGTPMYMSPEQAQGKQSELDERTDQFSLGAITYQMLTGRPPFQGTTVPTLLYQVVHEQPDPMRAFNPEVGPNLEAAVLRAMAKRPAERFPSVRDFHRELVRAVAADVAARMSGSPGPDPRLWPAEGGRPNFSTFEAARGERGATAERSGRAGRRTLAAVVGVGAAAILAALVLYLPRGASPPATAPTQERLPDPPPSAPAMSDPPPAEAPAPAASARTSPPEPPVIVAEPPSKPAPARSRAAKSGEAEKNRRRNRAAASRVPGGRAAPAATPGPKRGNLLMDL